MDVSDNAWYASAVNYVVDKGLMNGTGSNKFSPNADTTRGMIVIVLARLDGKNTAGTPWFAAGQRWAMEYEISDGTNMTGAITREQLVTMLFRYAVKNGLEAVTLSENLTQFTDASDISAWAVSAMQWAVGQGLIQGSNGQLRPQANASRAEVATILMRFCELMKKVNRDGSKLSLRHMQLAGTSHRKTRKGRLGHPFFLLEYLPWAVPPFEE